MKSILFINRVFPPDEGATGQLLADLAPALVAAGWNVTVVAAAGSEDRPAPSLPGVEVHRVRGLPFTRASNWRRALSYASLYPALLGRVLRLPRQDVVVTLTDPPLHLTLGPVIRLFKRCHLLHWAQDIYPEVAEELGVLGRSGLLARLLRAVSTWALRRHDRIFAVGRCMKDRLVARGVDAARIDVVPNWAVGFPEGSLPSRPSPARLTVMYSGNFGLAHTFEAIVEAVTALHRENAPVRFVFAGSGPKLTGLREKLSGCANVEFRAPEPLDQLPAALASADVHLACMREELCGLVVPSKVYGPLAAGRPCVFIGPALSEAARLLEETGCGVVLPVSGSRELTDLLRCWSRGEGNLSALRAACAAPERLGAAALARALFLRSLTRHLLPAGLSAAADVVPAPAQTQHPRGV